MLRHRYGDHAQFFVHVITYIVQLPSPYLQPLLYFVFNYYQLFLLGANKNKLLLLLNKINLFLIYSIENVSFTDIPKLYFKANYNNF